MNAKRPGFFQASLHLLGSLRLGTAILAAVILALGVATVVESSRGSEQSLVRVYQSSWFAMLLAMLGVNMLAAVAVRWPLQRKHFGFVLTHASIAVILIGAWTTHLFGLEGQLSIAEGQIRDSFMATQEMLAVAYGDQSVTADLEPPIGGLDQVDHPQTPELVFEPLDVRATIERYVPDSIVEKRMTDDGTIAQEAVQIAFSRAGSEESAWFFEGQSAHLGPASVTYRLANGVQMIGFLAGEHRNDWIAAGVVSVEFNGVRTDIPLADCLRQPVPIGGSGYRIKGINVWTHASVGSDGQLGNVSSLPTNPAVELEITERDGAENEIVDRRLVFSEYPEFDSNPGARHLDDLKATFSCPVVPKSETDVEIIRGPGGGIFARFAWEGTPEEVVRLDAGQPVETPWPGRSLTVLRHFTHAKLNTEIVPQEAIRPDRVAAMLVRVRKGEIDEQVWVRRGVSTPVQLGDETAYLVYAGKQHPLGFSVRLDQFRIDYYPGKRQPRSFESRLTFTDQATGLSERRLVSMNHPTTNGGLTFFQSSYEMDRGPTRSVLSVSRDPGMMIVFLGYVGTFLGMLIVLVSRMRDRRHGLSTASEAALAKGTEETTCEIGNTLSRFPKSGTKTTVRRRRKVVEAAMEAKK